VDPIHKYFDADFRGIVGLLSGILIIVNVDCFIIAPTVSFMQFAAELVSFLLHTRFASVRRWGCDQSADSEIFISKKSFHSVLRLPFFG
jgi:hypothetical protein